jgi:predicted component of type VI protein secretion system
MWVFYFIQENLPEFYVLQYKTYSVGRKGDLKIKIKKDETSISREHAKIILIKTENKSKILISDISKYGTFVNGKKIEKGEEVQLQEDDEIKFGIMNCKYR